MPGRSADYIVYDNVDRRVEQNAGTKIAYDVLVDGKTIVFTGTLRMKWADATVATLKAGGTVGSSVTGRTIACLLAKGEC
jgi:NAD-dependent DNA ligase